MEDQSEANQLKMKLRNCYKLWLVSLAATFATVYVYNKANPPAVERSLAQYQQALDKSERQIESLSAELLQTQRALKSAQKDLKQAIEFARQLQAKPPG